MRLRTVLAALLLCVGGWAAPAALAGVDAEASKACIECHDAEDLADSSRHAHSHPTDARTPGLFGLQAHHILPRGQGGENVLGNLLSDVLYAVVDPRIRTE